jgi:hypothetical protein
MKTHTTQVGAISHKERESKTRSLILYRWKLVTQELRLMADIWGIQNPWWDGGGWAGF